MYVIYIYNNLNKSLFRELRYVYNAGERRITVEYIIIIL